jgi:hypothetical protein
MRRRRIFAAMTAALAALFFAPLASADTATTAAPALPRVQSVKKLGLVRQNPVITMRDGTQSALFRGKSVWTFGDTAMSVAGTNGSNWNNNSLSWTENLDASHGITLEHDLTDSSGVPREFLPETRDEATYNTKHEKPGCQAEPCGAEFALWSAQVVADPARDRLLMFYVDIWRIAGNVNWRTVGTGIAVWKPGTPVVRPTAAPQSKTPTLMWSGDEVGYFGGSVVVGDLMYSYGCSPEWVVQHCRVARVKLADALDKSRWRYYAGGGNWSANPDDAKIVFDGGAAGNSVFYVPYLDQYMAIYSQPFTDDIMYRVAHQPWGPWSEAGLLFTGEPAWQDNFDYAAFAHPEFAKFDGRVQYVTYVRTTGLLRQEIPLAEIVFEKP